MDTLDHGAVEESGLETWSDLSVHQGFEDDVLEVLRDGDYITDGNSNRTPC